MTVLIYLVIAAIIGGALFVVAMLVFGRGEQLPALAPRTSPAQLPARDINGDHVRAVRFSLALRGYRMSDVDWTLERLSQELDRNRHRIAELESVLGFPGRQHADVPPHPEITGWQRESAAPEQAAEVSHRVDLTK